MNAAGLLAFTISALLSLAAAQPTQAVLIQLQPVADTTLIEISPDNNLGGTAFVNAGTAGSSGSFARNRGLYKFDLGTLPRASKINSAVIVLQVLGEPSGGAPSTVFAFHRMLTAWGEGDKNTTSDPSPGLGLTASSNEATWNSPFAFSTNTWTSPGAEGDFLTGASSSNEVYGFGDAPQFTSPQLIADVQLWVNNPTTNFGWLLKNTAESVPRTARRFGSREFAGEDTNSPPYLEIGFVAPPAISSLHLTNGQFRFSFLADTDASYKVEYKNALNSTNNWLILTNIAAPVVTTNITVADSISATSRFYRVVLQ